MKTMRIAFASLALAAALTSCAAAGDVAPAGPSGSPVTLAPPSAAGLDAPSVATTPDEAAAEGAFRSYYQALLARDYAKACGLNAPETTTALIDTLKAQGVVVGTCEEAFTTVYAIPGASEAADRIAKSTQIQRVTVNGDKATVTWSAEAQGQRRTVDNALRRAGDQWLLLPATP